MCGIALVFSRNGASSEILRKLLVALGRRGPDASGTVTFALRGHPGWSVSLGHTRLSIVGLGEIGNQPKSRLHRAGMVFNGEIYATQVRQTLRQAGIVSDTQWLWQRFESNDMACPPVGTNGIWGIATFDAEKEIVSVTRDPVGVIPVFVYEWRDGLIVSSEIQAISKAVGPLQVKLPELIKAVASRQLGYGRYIEGLSCVSPGETVRFQVRGGKVARVSVTSENYLRDYREDNSTFAATFDQAVFQQFQADVPLGIQLSGGADSTLIAATLARQGHQDLNAFVARAGGMSGWDEADLAVENARRLGLKPPVEVRIDEESFSNEILASFGNIDPAFSHPNFFAVKRIAAAAHEMGVRVLLCGEGADELFRGYSRLLPSNVARLLSTRLSLAVLSHVDARRVNFDRCVPGLARREMQDNLACHYQWIGDPSTRHLFSNYLHELLYRQNIAGMSHSVEVRPPFLDFNIVGFAMTHPKAFFTVGRGGVRLLKGTVKSHLHSIFPDYVGPRRKSGFAMPVQQLLNDDVIGLFERSVRFSANELAIDRTPWFRRFLKKELSTFEFERYLWPAMVTMGALAAAGHAC